MATDSKFKGFAKRIKSRVVDKAEELAFRAAERASRYVDATAKDATGMTPVQRIGVSVFRGGTPAQDKSVSPMGVAASVSKKAKRSDFDQRLPDETSVRGVMRGDDGLGGLHQWYRQQLRHGNTRLSTYRDMDLMDSECGELGRALDVIASNVVSSDNDNDEQSKSFDFGSDDKTYNRIMTDLDERAGLTREAWNYTREMSLMGDEFLSKVVDENGLIWRLKFLSPYSMWIVEDDRGVLIRYEQRDMSGDVKEVWEPWEILHLANDAPMGTRYGRGQLWRARKIYRQVNLMEDGAVVGVVTRAAQRFLHKVPIPDMGNKGVEVLKDYIQTRKRNVEYDSQTGTFTGSWNPLNEGDLYAGVNKEIPEAGIEVLQGQANFAQLVEVLQYFQDKLVVNSGVPPSYLGIERNVNAKATVQMEEIEFARSLRRKQQYLAQRLKDDVFGLQLYLSLGRRIPKDDYFVQFPILSKADEKVKAEIRKLNVESMVMLGKDLAISMDVVLTSFFGWNKEDAQTVADASGLPTDQQTEGYVEPTGNVLQSISKELGANERLRSMFETMAEAAACVKELSEPVRV